MVVDEHMPLLAEGSKPQGDSTKYRFLLIMPPIVFSCLAIGTSFYVSNEWIQQFVKSQLLPNGTLNSSSECQRENQSDHDRYLYERVESESAKWIMYNNLANTIPTVIISSILPSFSDSLGRRFVLIVSTIGPLVRVTITTCVIYYDLIPLYVVISSIFDGCTGSYFMFLSGISSYVADITKDGRQRTVGISVTDGILMIVFTLSSLGAGFFIKFTGYFIPSLACSGTLVMVLIYIVFCVPESFPKHRRSNTTIKVYDNFKRTFDFYISSGFKGKRTAYALLISVYFTAQMTYSYRASLEMLYQLGRPFCWTAERIGIFSAMRHATQGLTSIFLIRPMQLVFSDLTIAAVSVITNIGSFVLEGLAQTNLMLYMVTVVSAAAVLCSPMVKGIMSTLTPSDKQGALFASIGITQGVCAVCSNFLFNTIYADTVSFMSGFIFLVMAGFCVISLVILLVLYATQRHLLVFGSEVTKCINQ